MKTKTIKCKGQHYFNMLNFSTTDIGGKIEQSSFVICRKCGQVKIVKVR